MGIIWGSKDPKWCPQIDCRTSQCLTLDTTRWHLTYLQTVGKEVEKLKVVFWVQDRKIWKKTIRPTPQFPWSFQECPSGALPLSRPGYPWSTPGSSLQTIQHPLMAYFAHSKAAWEAPKKKGGTWGCPKLPWLPQVRSFRRYKTSVVCAVDPSEPHLSPVKHEQVVEKLENWPLACCGQIISSRVSLVNPRCIPLDDLTPSHGLLGALPSCMER